MRFFISEDERKRTGSTAFIEFQKGKFDGNCWHIDSICMDEGIFYDLHLRRFFSMMLPQFDYFGITQVSKEEFKKLVDSALNFSSDVSDCMKELSEWLEESGGGNDSILFTICGM